MKNQDNLSTQAVYSEISKQALRQRAEEMAQKNKAQSPEDLEEMPLEETQQMIYELRVHQIQLEMQNDELLRAQVELEDARERYLDLYDLAPVSYCTISEKGLIMEANLTAATLLGMARGMLIKQPFSRFIFKEDQDVYYLHRQHLFATGEPQEYELRMTKKDGMVFWSHLVAITLHDADGEPICRVVMNNITERKQAEAALRDSEERYLLMMDSTNDGIAMYNKEGIILNINSNFEKRIGKTKHELIGKNFKDLFTKEKYGDLCEQQIKIREVFDTGEAVIFENTWDGLTFSNRLYPVFTDDKVTAVTLFSMDITYRKNAEEEARRNTELTREAEILRKKEQEYLEILDGSTEGSWIYDVQSRKMEYSHQWLKRLGVEIESINNLFSYIETLLHPDDKERAIKEHTFLLEQKSPKYKMEYRIKTADSGYIWVLAQGKIIYDENGAPAKIYGTSMDITDRKSMEDKLIKQAVDLEQKNKLITDFFINLSHEFRTPISIMMLATELIEHYLKQTDINRENLTKHMEPIKQNTFRLSKLVNNLLDITKMDAGFWKPSLVDEDMVGILKYLVKSLKGFVNKRSLNIIFTCLTKIIMMPTDILMIDRIMLNLVSNALKHTPKGGFVKVNCQDFGDKIVISVRDNGEGIPDDKKDIIFDRFRQVNTSLTRSSEGCGIGLSLVKSMVEMLGGRIWFESILGVGSEFFVELPVLKIDEQHQSIEIGGLTLEQRIQIEFSDIAVN